MTETVFLVDENLTALGKVLQALYPRTVHICGRGHAPPAESPDGSLFTWCQRQGAVLITTDFNMLRDQSIRRDLLSREGLRVVWITLIRGQRGTREIERIIGRWHHVRETLGSNPGAMGLVLAANGQLRVYRSIGDAVVEVVRRGGDRPASPGDSPGRAGRR